MRSDRGPSKHRAIDEAVAAGAAEEVLADAKSPSMNACEVQIAKMVVKRVRLS
jgi:hypothetical protein